MEGSPYARSGVGKPTVLSGACTVPKREELETASAPPVDSDVSEVTVALPLSKSQACAEEPLHGSSTTCKHKQSLRNGDQVAVGGACMRASSLERLTPCVTPLRRAVRQRSVALFRSAKVIPAFRAPTAGSASADHSRLSLPARLGSMLLPYHFDGARWQSSSPTSHGRWFSLAPAISAPLTPSFRAATPSGSWLTLITAELLTISMIDASSAGRSAESSSGDLQPQATSQHSTDPAVIGTARIGPLAVPSCSRQSLGTALFKLL